MDKETRDEIEKQVAEYKQQEEMMTVNVHRLIGARLALEQLLKPKEESPKE